MQYLAKNYKNDSIVSVDMDKVGVMAAYCKSLCVCAVHCITPKLSISTDAIESFLVILAKHCTRLPHDRSSVIPNMLEYF